MMSLQRYRQIKARSIKIAKVEAKQQQKRQAQPAPHVPFLQTKDDMR